MEATDSTKKQATGAQITALLDHMKEYPEIAKGVASSALEREALEQHWNNLALTLNNMGGSVKSVEKWKQTWRDLKSNTKKRALKSSQHEGDGDQSHLSENDYVPSKKKYVSFDEELLRIEREKLNIEKDYKIKKIEVLSRIAAALEALTRKKGMKSE